MKLDEWQENGYYLMIAWFGVCVYITTSMTWVDMTLCLIDDSCHSFLHDWLLGNDHI